MEVDKERERKRQIGHLSLAAVALASVPVATLGLFGVILAAAMLACASVLGWFV